jgi:hypothetical protein
MGPTERHCVQNWAQPLERNRYQTEPSSSGASVAAHNLATRELGIFVESRKLPRRAILGSSAEDREQHRADPRLASTRLERLYTGNV